jgi:hypothetical protein
VSLSAYSQGESYQTVVLLIIERRPRAGQEAP